MPKPDCVTDDDYDEVLRVYSDIRHCGEMTGGVSVDIDEDSIICVLRAATDVLEAEKEAVIEVTQPAVLIGDIHGQLGDLSEFLTMSKGCGTRVFMGDYVDRGRNSIEVILLVLCKKIMNPKKVVLLRGNHEDVEMCERYGFQEECDGRYGGSLFVNFLQLFNLFPIAAIVGGKIFCVHGGLSSKVTKISEIVKPGTLYNDLSGMKDLLWADPYTKLGDGVDYAANLERGVGEWFSQSAADTFLKANGMTMLVRAHMVVTEGYEFTFGPGTNVVTVFSASNYGGEVGNRGAIMFVDENLHYSFKQITPDNYDHSASTAPPVESVKGDAAMFYQNTPMGSTDAAAPAEAEKQETNEA